mgnify:CR=1 FL=1
MFARGLAATDITLIILSSGTKHIENYEKWRSYCLGTRSHKYSNKNGAYNSLAQHTCGARILYYAIIFQYNDNDIFLLGSVTHPFSVYTHD